jgi:hypothetical protein
MCRHNTKQDWQEPDHNSYCTLVDWRIIETDILTRVRILLHIMDRIDSEPIDISLKHFTEALSWMSTKQFVEQVDDNRIYVVGGKEITAASSIVFKAKPKVKARIKVLVIVSGGIAGTVRSTDPSLDVEVLDWDNIREGDTFHDLRESGAIETLVANTWDHEVY